jgi:multidrug efflux pump subunit AcrB
VNAPIALMARNGVAANLLMLLIFVAGLTSAFIITQKVFPDFTLGRIEVRVEYRGADPGEIEQSIVQPIEEQIEAVEGIREVTATAAEGVGIVTAELDQGADVNQKLDEIQSRVNRITNFPERAEEPEVRELTNRRRVVEIAIYGDVPETTLKQLAYRVEDELAQKPDISFVQTAGIRDYEISIEVPQDTLRAYGLSLPQIAQRVAANSLDLPAGDVETGESQLLVRVEGEALRRDAYADIVVLARGNGAELRLGDIAKIEDGFRDTGLITRYNGKPAAIVEVYRTGDEKVLQIADAVTDYLDRLEKDLPEGVEAEIWQNEAESFRSRLSLLLSNGLVGAALVLITLGLFLRLRVAFWVASGVVISFVGTLAVMSIMGVSINQLSMFGFILALGIVVDDAIIVGENIDAEREAGAEGPEAAVEGAQRVALPVIFAVSTTIIAFIPLLFLPGNIGKLLSDVPIVVITVLAISLVDSLFILPHHLSGMKPRSDPSNRVAKGYVAAKGWLDARLKSFTGGPIEKGARFSCQHYGVVLAGFFALMLVTIGLFAGGYLRFVFFPEIEGESVTASFGMPVGSTDDASLDLAERLAAAGKAAARKAAEEGEDGGQVPDGGNRSPLSGPGASLVRAYSTTIGYQPQDGGGGTQITSPSSGAVRFKLFDADKRETSAAAFEEAWREEMGPVPLADYVSFSSSVVDAGNPVAVELSHPDPEVLAGLVERVKRRLHEVGGVYDIYDTQEEGQEELEIELMERARTFGVTLQDVAGQVRAAYFGTEALRVQRGREEVRVYVRLPEAERDSLADVYDYRIRTGESEIPLSEVAAVGYGAGPSSISRRNGQRIITVNGDVQPGIITGQEATSQLRTGILAELKRDYPDLSYAFGGAQREQQRTLPALLRAFGLALFAIYALLAVSFRSYTQPLVILLVIPFGLIGAAFGHLLLGINVTILSLYGLVGLCGVVVNDALILLDFANARRLGGDDEANALVQAAKARFRPILLTSVTTFLGIAPITFSQSVQAQFLVPLAVSLAFGILFATILQMLLVPALAKAQFDAERFLKRKLLGQQDPDVVHGSPGGGAG